MQLIAETTRLIIREITVEDAQAIFNLNQDPLVIKYTSDPAFKSVEDASKLIEENIRFQYREYGIGRWAVIAKHDHSFLGWCGLKFRTETNEIDLGYRYFQHAWGKGYATEAAQACLKYGLHTKKLQRIIGCAMQPNVASIKVLEKCGMTFCRYDFLHGHEAVVYEKVAQS